MLKEERKVGPKGQVVIPKRLRETKKIKPRTDVVFEITDEGILIENPSEKTEEVFGEVVNSSNKVKRKIESHEVHDEELEKEARDL